MQEKEYEIIIVERFVDGLYWLSYRVWTTPPNVYD